jgi:Mg2+/Co2+ transporter CorB
MRFIPLLLTLFLSVSIDHTKVRYGNSDLFKEDKGYVVAVLDSKQVYSNIPAYKKISKEKVQKGSARYYQLMSEATKVYRNTLSKVARNNDYFLIVEVGGITGYPTTEITKICIEQL